MRAAVVRAFDRPPRCEEWQPPLPRDGEEEVEVLAAGLHPRVRSGADGSHYSSGGELPLVPGIDGVGRTARGGLVYFVLPDTVHGSMAERAVIDRRRSVPLPDDVDPVAVAAAMNPAMSSWIALRRRAALRPGQAVLVLGATGNAGRMAVEVARRLGASRVVAAGRDPERLALLPDLGADAVVALGADEAGAALGEAAGDVDVVVDYLWAEPAARAMRAVVVARRDRARALDWIQVGAVAGPDIVLPSALLRAANVRVMGSGQGSVATEDIVAELPALVAEIAAGGLTVAADPVPLSDVEDAWSAPAAAGRRVVLTP